MVIAGLERKLTIKKNKQGKRICTLEIN